MSPKVERVGDSRCVVHPSRPAYDDCPTCGRARCFADAEQAPGGGCLVCLGTPDADRRRPKPDLRAVVGAACLAHLAAFGAAAIGAQYVDVKWFSTIVPFIGGIVCGAAAERGAGRARGLVIRLVAVGYAVLGAAMAFRLVPGEPTRWEPLPYLAAAAGAWLWTAPPRTVKPKAEDDGQERATRSK